MADIPRTHVEVAGNHEKLTEHRMPKNNAIDGLTNHSNGATLTLNYFQYSVQEWESGKILRIGLPWQRCHLRRKDDGRCIPNTCSPSVPRNMKFSHRGPDEALILQFVGEKERRSKLLYTHIQSTSASNYSISFPSTKRRFLPSQLNRALNHTFAAQCQNATSLNIPAIKLFPAFEVYPWSLNEKTGAHLPSFSSK